MQSNAFISYRRSDSTQIAQALRVQFLQRFGPGSAFMDVAGIPAGAAWPDRLERAIRGAAVVLVVVGPNWLTAADRFGRRRLDQHSDWVRHEICAALEAKKAIISLLVGGLVQLPEDEGLPPGLRPIRSIETFSLRDERWDSDVANLAGVLVEMYGFKEGEALVMKPNPEKQAPPLTAEELDKQLALLPGWEPVKSSIPRDYPKTRQELRRVFVFDKFEDAIAFMGKAVPLITARQHHPRWENQWRTVIVYLSTWDIGNRISSFDVDLAHELDAIYTRMCKSSKKQHDIR